MVVFLFEGCVCIRDACDVRSICSSGGPLTSEQKRRPSHEGEVAQGFAQTGFWVNCPLAHSKINLKQTTRFQHGFCILEALQQGGCLENASHRGIEHADKLGGGASASKPGRTRDSSRAVLSTVFSGTALLTFHGSHNLAD